MSQAAIARMYNTTPQNITMHIKNIYEAGESVEEATCKEFLQVQTEGTRQVKRNKTHYNFYIEDYFDELLERIRDIRASEKRFYQKICEIYKTSISFAYEAKCENEIFACE